MISVVITGENKLGNLLRLELNPFAETPDSIKIIGDVEELDQIDYFCCSLPGCTSTLKLYIPPTIDDSLFPNFDKLTRVYYSLTVDTSVLHRTFFLESVEQNNNIYTLRLIDVISYYGRTNDFLGHLVPWLTDVFQPSPPLSAVISKICGNALEGYVAVDIDDPSPLPFVYYQGFYNPNNIRDALGYVCSVYGLIPLDNGQQTVFTRLSPADGTIPQVMVISGKIERFAAYSDLEIEYYSPSYQLSFTRERMSSQVVEVVPGTNIIPLKDWAAYISLVENDDIAPPSYATITFPQTYDANPVHYCEVSCTSNGYITIYGNPVYFLDDADTKKIHVADIHPPRSLRISLAGGRPLMTDTFINRISEKYNFATHIFKGRIKVTSENEVIGSYVEVIINGKKLRGFITSMRMLMRQDIFADVEILGTLVEDSVDKYTITFSGGDGATGIPPSVSPKYEGDSFRMPDNTFTKTGHAFTGWLCNTSSLIHYPGDIFIMPAADVTFTAQWEGIIAEYRVEHKKQTLDATGYELVATETFQGLAGELTQARPKLFFGFISLPFEQQEISPDGTTVVEILYNRKVHIVTFDSQDPTASPAIQTQEVLHENQASEPIVPTKPTGIFSGWYTDPECTNSYDFTLPVTRSRTLYANWEPLSYTITFSGGDGATGIPPLMIPRHEGESFHMPENTFTKTGYGFMGWSDGIRTYLPSDIFIMPAADVTFTAQWTKKMYLVIFTINNYYYQSGSFYYADPVTAPHYEVPAGYDFLSWVCPLSMPAHDVTIDATLTAILYNITYSLDHGAWASRPGGATSFTINDLPLSIPNPVRQGYDFLGWTGSNGSIQQSNLVIAAGDIGDKTYTAHWEELAIFVDEDFENAYRHKYNISGSISLASVRNRQTLQLEDCNPKLQRIDDVALFSGLTSLALDRNKISDISPIGTLQQLRSLWLYSNNISVIPNGMDNVAASLVELYIAFNKIERLGVLENFDNLQILDMSSNKLSEIDKSGNLASLVELRVKNNDINEIDYIGAASNLSKLLISGNKLSDNTDFTSLVTLHGTIENLEIISQKGSPLSPRIVDFLRQSLPGCTVT